MFFNFGFWLYVLVFNCLGND
uniref:Uncharacterized protein n=1 Tax=Rhizophora mucronata TaxID=61149 RepID=A0A2P2QIZ9_RHIMU